MASAKGVVPRAVIAAGGRSRRMQMIIQWQSGAKRLYEEIFKGQEHRIPKRFTVAPTSKIHVKVGGTPLMAHQIKLMLKEGVREFLLVFRTRQQVEEFQRFREEGMYPEARYEFFVEDEHERAPSQDVFKMAMGHPQVRKFVGKQPFLFSYGDNYFGPDVIRHAVETFRQRKATLFLAELISSSANESDHKTAYTIEQALAKKEESKYAPAFTAAILTPETRAHFERQTDTAPNRSLMELMRRANEAGHASVIMHMNSWNVNHPIDYIRLQQIHAGELDFHLREKK